MIITYKYKIYNSKKNRKLFRLSKTARYIYNHCVALNRRYYQLTGKSISKSKLQKHIGKVRNRTAEWKDLNSQTVQMITHKVTDSYKRFFKKLSKRPPKFKNRFFNMSFDFTQAGYKLNNNSITINNIGVFKFHKSREFKPDEVMRIKIKKDNVGDWFIYLALRNAKNSKFEKSGNAAIGIDFGLKTFLTLSDSTEIKSPEFFKSDLDKIRKANKALSRKKRGSNNRGKARKSLQRLHRSISNRRSDFHWKLAHKLASGNSFIAIEDLNLDGMKRLFGKKVSDLGFGDFVKKLEYISTKYKDTTVQKIGRFFPSSKLCTCGVKNEVLSLRDREWSCSSCGEFHNRDLLAAKNILTEGIRLYLSGGKTGLPAPHVCKIESQ